MTEAMREKANKILSEAPEDKKDAFLAEYREAKTSEERFEIAKKHFQAYQEEQLSAFNTETGNAVPDEELDQAAGGCDVQTGCHSGGC